MKARNLIFILVLAFSNIAFAKRERYQSRSSSPQSSYESKFRGSKERFDKNLNQYNRYSPQEKRKAMDKWQDFKSETTPEERDFIRNKLRRERRRGR